MKSTSVANLAQLGEFDEIIDVRSPAEFAEDHMPGAVNCPVLSNEERARVGTIYKQESPFAAKKLGAALVARHIAEHIEQRFLDQPREWRPLVYCWRGGKRSGAFTHVQHLGGLENPSFLAINADGTRLYSVHGDRTEANSFVIDSRTGNIAHLNRQPTGGYNPVHLAFDATGRYLDEMGWSEAPFIAEVHETLRRTRMPVYGWYEWDFRDHLAGYSEFGFFPLSRDGTSVSESIGFDDCSEFEQILDRAR